MAPSEKRPAEVSTFLLRRQQVLASQCSSEVRRCTMEHELRVTDLRFHQRRYHRILSWLDDVRGRCNRSQKQRQSLDPVRPRKATIPSRSTSKSLLLPKAKMEGDLEETFVTRLQDMPLKQADTESERRRYDALIRGTRKDPFIPVTKADYRRSSVDPKLHLSVDRKRMAVLPALPGKSSGSKAKLHRPVPLSAIPEADLNEEIRAAELAGLKSRRRSLQIPKVKVSTPCSTPHSSRTPLLSPITELPPTSTFSIEEEE